MGTFRELMKAAKKARCEETVRPAALRFLETGTRPDGKAQPATKAAPAASPSAWPLPALPAAILRGARFAHQDAPGPRYDVLLELAVEEKNSNEVLRWYDRLAETKQGRTAQGWGWQDYRSRVARAVADSNPDRAEALYRDLITEQLAFTKVSAYESAEPYLVALKALLTKNKRAAEWTKYLADLHETHFRKPRLIDVLDRVESGRSKR
jgi:uncharacterized Zn finger protein